jgi:hypothetical protein
MSICSQCRKEKKMFKVTITNTDGYGNYWTEVVGVYESQEQASDRAFELECMGFGTAIEEV